ncbi:MAG: hypothetical protein IJZ35_07335 [Clostridia bacterium]|nr:hypothetical protein [Clostridia bacterium]
MNYEEIIEKIEDILEASKPSFGSNGKVKVDGAAIHECLEELSSSIPNEIIQARKIVAERREILQAAQETASKIVNDAQIKAEELTEEHEITRSAKDAAVKILNETNDKAKEIITEANAEAENRENSAKAWSYEMRSSASTFAVNLLSECITYLDKNISMFEQSRENAQMILSKVQQISIKTPEDQE